jgi:hypothetical protein
MLTKAITTAKNEHIVYNKIGVWPNLKYLNVFKCPSLFCFNLISFASI